MGFLDLTPKSLDLENGIKVKGQGHVLLSDLCDFGVFLFKFTKNRTIRSCKMLKSIRAFKYNGSKQLMNII